MMTEEQKKPDVDEVTDEQLEEVSGGSKGSADMCATPMGGAVPNPYPNVPTTNGSGDSGTVASGDLSSSGGDESETIGGTISTENMRKNLGG